MTFKKVGILNFQFSEHNYGAVLQAAALEHTVKQLGYKVEHINYLPYDKKNIKNKLKYSFIGHLIKVFLKKSHFYDYRKNSSCFEQFRSAWIKRSIQNYYTSDDIKKNSQHYGAIIVGSDQVWRPKMYSNLHSDTEVYFLQTVPNSIKKIAYAASFGVDHWEHIGDSTFTESIYNSLKDFTAISVRESSGVTICQDIFHEKATHVLDPTLLSDKTFFEKIINSEHSLKSSDLVYYKLDENQEFKKSINDICTLLNYSMKNIYFNESLFLNSYITVPAWLSYIKDSKLVITDSFHCVCFAIIFNKNFFCIRNKSRGESRLESLLTLLGLENRLLYQNELLDATRHQINIDYKDINKRLETLKESSLSFLKNALM
ncbi:polysaccharide pyruvyl transferase family protein [Providencia rettgeri]|uniref:polysaccharide pyruvyl transferase family protein n=1 Tax=Providencia rettgeri TaxID=587 RepID=UPI00235DDB7A|nr:polysaccharide pyruvyl transferase family protein [Providencia rettgeri]